MKHTEMALSDKDAEAVEHIYNNSIRLRRAEQALMDQHRFIADLDRALIESAWQAKSYERKYEFALFCLMPFVLWHLIQFGIWLGEMGIGL